MICFTVSAASISPPSQARSFTTEMKPSIRSVTIAYSMQVERLDEHIDHMDRV
jgi:hypothetical protein